MATRRIVCPAVDLEAARHDGEVLGLLKATTQRTIRRSLKGFGPLQTEWAATPEHALDILDELIDLHQRRWQAAGEPGVFASARRAGFYRALVPRLVPRGALLLFRARAAGQTIGCLYNLVDDGAALFQQSGLASFDDNKLKPGLVLHALCMQACLERGLREYNFLAWNSRYKEELSTGSRELVWATARRRRPALLLVEGLRHVRDALGRARTLAARRRRA